MLTGTGIKERVQKEICLFTEKHQMKKVVLFGSRARGDFHRACDIDLAVWAETSHGLPWISTRRPLPG